MPSNEAKDAMQLAVRLSVEDLRELRAFVDMRLALKGAAASARADSLADQVLLAICDGCRNEGIGAPGLDKLKAHRAYAKYAEAVDENVAPLLEMAKLKRRAQKHGFLRVIVRLLIKDLQEMRVPVSAIMVMRNIWRAQSVIENSFPGYAKHGLLYLVSRMEGQLDEPQAEAPRKADDAKKAGGRKDVLRSPRRGA